MATSTKRFVVYGANGVVGRKLVAEAVRRGHRPLVAGRSLSKLAPVADAFGLEAVAVSLEDREALERLVARARVMLHAAGPFGTTAESMRRACLAQRAHYVDVATELEVIAGTYAHDARAKRAGITMVSAAGTSASPSDCLAMHVTRRIVRPTHLEIAVEAPGPSSRGTLLALAESLGRGGRIRHRGELTAGPLLAPRRRVRMGPEPCSVAPVPLADLATAWHSTGIAEIETYVALPGVIAQGLRVTRPLLLRALAERALRERVFDALEARLPAPTADDEPLDARRTHVWVSARNARGDVAESWLEGPDTLTWTARCAWLCAERVLDAREHGAHSPAQLLGADGVLTDDVTRHDH